MGDIVQFASNGKTASGYLALPKQRGPAVVVIQEYWGLVPHIKDVADRFAAEGFVALAPDLFHGQIAKSPDEAGKMMMAMRIDEAERDLRGAVTFVLAHPQTSSRRAGMIGFCMGGALSLFAASKNPEVGACAVFYGGHPNVKPDLAALRAPVLGLYAGNDTFASPQKALELEKQLKALGKPVEIHIYPNVDHAFFNDTRPEVYNKEAAGDAWSKTIAFFRAHLT
jgi:carboxymethylenebutenolidase